MTVKGLELKVADEWLYTTLAGDDVLTDMLGNQDPPGIFNETIPKDVTYPYIIWNLVIESDTITSRGDTLLVITDLAIKGVDRGPTYERLAPISQRLYQLLHQQSG